MNIISKFISNVRLVGEERGAVQWGVMIIAAMVLNGCTSGAISSIELDPAQPPVCDTSVTPNICGVPQSQPISLIIRGKGMCSPVFLNCGNGTGGIPYGASHDFGQPPADQPLKIECKYDKGWPGPKTIRVYSNGSDCVGESTLAIRVMNVTGGTAHADFQLGFGQPVTTACSEVPVSLPLRKHTKVSIKTNPNPNIKIDFGCTFGCVYDADGEPNSSAPASFAFPGLRKYSLVLRVGQQVVQGGTNMSFITNQGGRLEVCVNDDQLSDNYGGWLIGISVDESQAP